MLAFLLYRCLDIEGVRQLRTSLMPQIIEAPIRLRIEFPQPCSLYRLKPIMVTGTNLGCIEGNQDLLLISIYDDHEAAI